MGLVRSVASRRRLHSCTITTITINPDPHRFNPGINKIIWLKKDLLLNLYLIAIVATDLSTSFTLLEHN